MHTGSSAEWSAHHLQEVGRRRGRLTVDIMKAVALAGSLRRFLLSCLAATAAVAPVAEPTADDAGNCGIFGEDGSQPPVPLKIMLTCGGAAIEGVSYAVYGQPKGKCGDGDFGSGSGGTFEDVNPQCKGMDLKAKFAALCLGKTSCELACPPGAPCNGETLCTC